jgi:AraC-like DNA-binding protein
MKAGKSRLVNQDSFKADFDYTKAQGPSSNQAASLKSVAEAKLSELFAFKECQDLFRTRLTGPMLRLIPQLTGLRLHVLWHRPMDFHGPGEIPVLCPRACQSRKAGGAKGRQPNPDIRCRGCLQRRWKPVLSPANQGQRFIGQCGATNFCACLLVDKVCPLTLVLQARVVPGSNRTGSWTMNPGVAASRQSAAIIRKGSQQRSAETLLRDYGSWKPVSSSAFHDAVALARLILHDLESAAQARMAEDRLGNALRRLKYTQTEAARLRGKLHRRLPGLPPSTINSPPSTIPKSHAQKLVAAMLDYVHQHCHRPISLDDLASAMKRNASYLSALFSQMTGVTFHQFLEEIRLSKARELLRDPRNRVREVARAAGYASPDAFRHAFKAHEGLSPEAWRAGQ